VLAPVGLARVVGVGGHARLRGVEAGLLFWYDPGSE
jgi:hypothetical protein